MLAESPHWGAGIAQWLEHRTRDWKVAGSNPCRNGGRIFFSRVDFLCWLLFRYPFHPRVTAVARKKSRSFCQKCRWQVTAKTRIHLTYVAFIEPCFGIGHNLSLICQMTSEDIKHQLIKPSDPLRGYSYVQESNPLPRLIASPKQRRSAVATEPPRRFLACEFRPPSLI